MTLVHRTWGQSGSGGRAGADRLMQIVTLAGLLAVATAALRIVAPVILVIAEVLLGVGQACMTWLRASGL